MNNKQLLGILSLMLFSCSSLAQEEADSEGLNENENIADIETETVETQADADENGTSNEDEDFVPSIQISEDLSVSFPVDI